jgi:hypothetical protein
MQTNRSNLGALIGGVILIGIGILSLMSRVLPGFDWGNLWPFLIIGIGAMFFIVMFASGKSGAAFAVPGSIIGGIGLILLFQNIIGRWETMSYFWTLILIFVGLGIYIMGWYGEDARHKKSGADVMKVGFFMFIIFGVIFETIFSSFGSQIFPVLLILLGVYLLISRSGLFNRKQENLQDTSNNQPLPPVS